MAEENESEREDEQDEESDTGASAPDDPEDSPARPSSERDDASEDARAERELRRDSEQAAREADARREDDLPITGTLGLERWVQFAFIAIALALVYITDKVVTFQGDASSRYEWFVKVLDAARASGALHVNIAHQPLP